MFQFFLPLLRAVAWVAIAAIAGVAYTSFVEYCLHRWVMHRPVRIPFTALFFGKPSIFEYPFKAHALVHHHVFKYDETYHLQVGHEEDKKTIPMAWWNAPVLILIGSALTLPFNFLFGHWWTLGVVAGVLALYYWAYERMHWCMHLPKLPKSRRLEQGWIFQRLNGHHLLHHRYMNRNFNVVLPLADLCFGTLVLRSKTRFKQATGPAVPDVQPKESNEPHRKIVFFET